MLKIRKYFVQTLTLLVLVPSYVISTLREDIEGSSESLNSNLEDIENKFKLIDRIDKLGYHKEFFREDKIQFTRNKLSHSSQSFLSNELTSNYNDDKIDPYKLRSSLTENQILSGNSLRHANLDDSSNTEAIQLADEINVNVFNTSYMYNNCIRNGTYCLKDQIFKGGHGEIFRSYQISSDGTVLRNVTYILKRMQTASKFNIKMAAEREIYFGKLLQSSSNMPRFINYFILNDTDYWLIYRDEGISLQQLFYAMSVDSTSVMLKPSNIWKKFRTTEIGRNSMRTLLRQIILHVSELHEKSILHRDIKLSNILLNTEIPGRPHIVINDFSSAMNEESLTLHLFDQEPLTATDSGSTKSQSKENSNGINMDNNVLNKPTQLELTIDYAAPEVRLNTDLTFSYDPDFPYSYDIFSIGVVFLEILLGTQQVFDMLDERTKAMINFKLKSKYRHRHHVNANNNDRLDNEKQNFEKRLDHTLFLTALAEFGIFDPQLHTFKPHSTASSTVDNNDKSKTTNDNVDIDYGDRDYDETVTQTVADILVIEGKNSAHHHHHYHHQQHQSILSKGDIGYESESEKSSSALSSNADHYHECYLPATTALHKQHYSLDSCATSDHNIIKSKVESENENGESSSGTALIVLSFDRIATLMNLTATTLATSTIQFDWFTNIYEWWRNMYMTILSASVWLQCLDRWIRGWAFVNTFDIIEQRPLRSFEVEQSHTKPAELSSLTTYASSSQSDFTPVPLSMSNFHNEHLHLSHIHSLLEPLELTITDVYSYSTSSLAQCDAMSMESSKYCKSSSPSCGDRAGESTTATQDDKHSSLYTHERLQQAILKHDPIGLGFSDKWGLDLLSRLLAFNPKDRIPLSEALEHAYFKGSAYISEIDGSEHPTANDLYNYDMARFEEFNDPIRNVVTTTSTTTTFTTSNINSNPDCSKAMITYANTALAPLDDYSISLWFECASQYQYNIDYHDSTEFNYQGSSSEPHIVISGEVINCEYEDDDNCSSINSNDDMIFREDRDESVAERPEVVSNVQPLTCHDFFLDFSSATTAIESNSASTNKQDSYPPSLSSSPSDIHSVVKDTIEVKFKCPICQREFDNYQTCVHHASVRKHGINCLTYYRPIVSSVAADDSTVSDPVRNDENNDKGISISETIKEGEIDESMESQSVPVNDSGIGIRYKKPHSDNEYVTVMSSIPAALRCLSTHTHSLQPIDSQSGWCDLKGRRRYMEDHHSMSHEWEYSYYAVHDGHYGSRTARVMAKNHHTIFRNQLLWLLHNQSNVSLSKTNHHSTHSSTSVGTDSGVDGSADDEFIYDFTVMRQRSEEMLSVTSSKTFVPQSQHLTETDKYRLNLIVSDPYEILYKNNNSNAAGSSTDSINDVSAPQETVMSVEMVVNAFYHSYLYIDKQLFNDFVSSDSSHDSSRRSSRNNFHKASKQMDYSGSTTAAALVFPKHIVISNIGDSRIVLCCDPSGSPVQLTIDHTPHILNERNNVIKRGGFVTNDIYKNTNSKSNRNNGSKTIPRVNGVLAITRSIGDLPLKSVLSNQPDILVIHRDSHREDSVTAESESTDDTSSGGKESIKQDSKISTNQLNICQKYQQYLSLSESATEQNNVSKQFQLFLIIASDGFWETVSNQDAVDLVCSHLLSSNQYLQSQKSNEKDVSSVTNSMNHEVVKDDSPPIETVSSLKQTKKSKKRIHGSSYSYTSNSKRSTSKDMLYHDVAEILSREAYLRGSNDNIGTCVVNLH